MTTIPRIMTLVTIAFALVFTTFSQPKLVLNDKEIDLGQIFNGEIVKARITVHSAGSKPLKILRVNASCGCTTVKEPKNEIPPGKSDVVEVEFNSSGFRGKAVKYVYIETNDPDNKHASVTLTADIREELEPVQKYSLIWFGDVPVGKSAEQTYALKNVSGSPIIIKGVNSSSKAVNVSFDRQALAPNESVTLTVRVNPKEPGYLNETFFVETDSRQRRVPVRVSLVGVKPQ